MGLILQQEPLNDFETGLDMPRNRFLGFEMERGVGDGRAGESWAGGGRVPPLQPALGTQYPYSKTICKNCTAFPLLAGCLNNTYLLPFRYPSGSPWHASGPAYLETNMGQNMGICEWPQAWLKKVLQSSRA